VSALTCLQHTSRFLTFLVHSLCLLVRLAFVTATHVAMTTLTVRPVSSGSTTSTDLRVRLLDHHNPGIEATRQRVSEDSNEPNDGFQAVPAVHESIALNGMNRSGKVKDQSQLSNGDQTSSTCDAADKVDAVRWNGYPLYSLTWEVLGILVSLSFFGKFHLRAFVRAIRYRL
jgi:hypothetical protein